jgi:ribosomal protein S19
MRPTQALLKSGRSAWKGEDSLCLDLFIITLFFWQGPYFIPFVNLREALTNHTPIKTQARSCTILPNFVGYVYRKIFSRTGETEPCNTSIRFDVYNGKDYLPVVVTQDMVGHKLGEFSSTKKRFIYRFVVSHDLGI